MTLVAATEPYPWPYDSALAGPPLALVLAGWDAVWAGRVVPEEAAATTAAARALAAATVGVGGSVVTVAHGGAVPAAPPHPAAEAVTATGLDGFWGGPLDARLRSAGCRYLLVAGHGLEAPVHSLLRGANDRGYECLLVADASSALDPDLRIASTSMVCMSGGIFGAVGAAADVRTALASLLAPTPTPIPTGAFP